MSDRGKYALIVVVLGLATIVVVAGAAHNDLNYTSTAAILVGAVVALATGKKPPGGGNE